MGPREGLDILEKKSVCAHGGIKLKSTQNLTKNKTGDVCATEI